MKKLLLLICLFSGCAPLQVEKETTSKVVREKYIDNNFIFFISEDNYYFMNDRYQDNWRVFCKTKIGDKLDTEWKQIQ